MVIAIKRKEHAALSTKIVDGKYFLKGHLNFVSLLFCQSPHPLIESSIVEDDKATVRGSVASRKKRSLAEALLQRQHDVMTSLAASPSQSAFRRPYAAANQHPVGRHQQYKRRAPCQSRHLTRHERVCRISPIEREYPSLS